MGIRVTGAIQLHGLSQTKTELNACEQQAAAADAAAATETPADAMRGARLVHALLSQMVPLASGRVSEADAISRVTAAAAAPAKRKAVVVGIDYTAASDASVKLTGAIKDAHTVQVRADVSIPSRREVKLLGAQRSVIRLCAVHGVAMDVHAQRAQSIALPS
jgi:outer membrane protein W